MTDLLVKVIKWLTNWHLNLNIEAPNILFNTKKIYACYNNKMCDTNQKVVWY